MASRTVSTVFSRYFGIAPMNCAIQEYLCQDGFGFTSSGAPGRVIHLMPLKIVDHRFHTSALEADSWPPLANDVSIAA